MRRALLRATAVFIAFFGLLCLVFPVVMVAWSDAGPGLVADTRAFFGAGVTVGVPVITQVHCVRQRYGTSRGTSHTRIGASEYECDLTLGATGDGMSPALREANEAVKAAQTTDA